MSHPNAAPASHRQAGPDGDERQMQGEMVVPAARPPRSGDACPACGTGRLDYDGLLNLSCLVCGCVPAAGGCFS